MNIKTLKAIKKIFGTNDKVLPVLNCFYIDSEFLYFNRLDLAVRLRHYFPFKEKSPAIVIDANNFIARTETIKAPYIINSDNDCHITFESPESTTKIKGCVPGEYPMPPINKEHKELFTLSGSEIRLMNIAKEFVADDELRPVMSAVCISEDHIVSSDAHKLYYRKIGKKTELNVLIDTKAIRIMMLSGGASFVISSIGDNLRAESDDMTIYWRSCQKITNNLIDSGNYPNWKSVLPKTDKMVIIPVSEFINSIAALRFALNTASGQLICEIKGSSLLLEAKDIDYGTEATEKLAIINSGNVEIRFGIKAIFVKEILKMFKDEGRPQISLSFSEPSRAFVFADSMLIMPMMLHE
jgi:hypothetical protein